MSEDKWRNNSRGYALIHKSIDFHINPKRSFKEGRVSERKMKKEESRGKNLINEEKI